MCLNKHLLGTKNYIRGKAVTLHLFPIKLVGSNCETKKQFSFEIFSVEYICCHRCSLPPQSVVESRGLKADEWVQAVSTVIGGKAGGKPVSAQGSGDKIDDVPKAMDIAKEFARLKLSN